MGGHGRQKFPFLYRNSKCLLTLLTTDIPTSFPDSSISKFAPTYLTDSLALKLFPLQQMLILFTLFNLDFNAKRMLSVLNVRKVCQIQTIHEHILILLLTLFQFHSHFSHLQAMQNHLHIFNEFTIYNTIHIIGIYKMFKQMHDQWCILLGLLLFIFGYPLGKLPHLLVPPVSTGQ